MDFFEKHKALIITSLFCGVLLLGLYNFNLSEKQKKISELMIDLEQLETEEEPETPEEQEETEQESQPQTETHRAFNENQESRHENFDRQLDEIFEKNSANNEENNDNDNSAEGEFNVGKSANQRKETSDGNDASKETSTQSGSMRNSSISFSLKGRSAVNIPNPIYTCDRPGKVVINIQVNADGRVTQTAVNKSSSSSSNECLTEKALEYAASATFSKLPGRENQPGTITYQFQP